MLSVYASPSTQDANRFIVGGITEEQNSNAVTDIFEKALREKYGITVYRNRPDMNLSEIIADSNAKKPNIHVAIHSNAGGGRGCEVYAYEYTSGVSNSHRLAQYIYDEFSAITPSSDRGIKNGVAANLGEVVRTTACAVLIEMAFHDNVDDANWLINQRQACSTALEKGMCKYFGIAYKPDVVSQPEPVPAPTPTPTPTPAGTIEIGSTVKIKAGAVYGGLSSSRGVAVPAAKIGIPYKVLELANHKDVDEARLESINSWVAIASLELVATAPTPAPISEADYNNLIAANKALQALCEQAQAELASAKEQLSSAVADAEVITNKYNNLIAGLKALL